MANEATANLSETSATTERVDALTMADAAVVAAATAGGMRQQSFFRFAAGMRAVLALVAAFSLLSTPPSSQSSFLLVWVMAYLLVAAAIVAATMHGYRMARLAVWYWIDAAWLIVICSTGLSGVPGIAALLMLPIIALALQFNVWHAIGLAVCSAAVLLAPHVSGGRLVVGHTSLPYAHLGVALCILACGPLSVWLVRPARATRRHRALVDALIRDGSPKQGLSINVQNLFQRLAEHYPFERAYLSLAGPEPRIFAWSKRGDARTLEGDELAVIGQSLSRAGHAMVLSRPSTSDIGLRVIDLKKEKSYLESNAMPWIWITPSGHGALIPVLSYGQAGGHLWLTECSTAFEETDVYWLRDIMTSVMPLLDRSDLLEQLQRESALHERERIGRDLHDSAVQPYVGLKYGLEAVARLAGRDNPVYPSIAQLLQLTQDELQNLRDVVGGLRRGEDESMAPSAVDAIERQARRFEKLYGLKVSVFAPQSARLRGALGKHVLHMINESLTNVRRHTSAKAVTVLVDVGDNEVILRLRNDHGIDESLPPDFLPTSLQQRCAELGGTCTVAHERDFTEVLIRIPSAAVRHQARSSPA